MESMQACDTALSEYSGKATEPGVALTAAKFAWLMGKPRAALATLKRTGDEAGEKEVPPDLGTGRTVDVVCQLWSGTIARHSGDALTAKRVHEVLMAKAEARKEYAYLRVYSALYLSEIEFGIMGNRDIAIKHLDRLHKEPRPIDAVGQKMWELYNEWASFEQQAMAGKKDEALRSIKGSDFKLGYMARIAMEQLDAIGVTAQPRSGLYNDTGRVLLIRALDLASENATSGIDRQLALVLLGTFREQAGETDLACRAYQRLLEQDGFFSPEGGLLMARCQKKSGQQDKASATLDRVGEKFPGYLPLVEKSR